MFRYPCLLLLAGGLVVSGCAPAAPARRNAWYHDAVVVLHIDNHSGLVGKGHTVDELVEMVRDVPVSMIQVSAFGATGTTTYPTTIRPHPSLGDWDTLAAWRQVARKLGRRFCVYINTRGLRISKDHPEWTQLNAQGKGKGRHGGLDICVRPSPDGTGALEAVFLPMLREIVARYKPDGIWVDGDHARTAVCYCPHCKAAWKAATGSDQPPTSPEDPQWPRWLQLEQQRCDDYRRQMAEVIHTTHDGCMYTSNHSWRFRSRDPRCPPDYVDTLSGDLSHGPALRLTRLSAMQISPEERVPCDTMHNIRRIADKPVSLRRVLQQGALTFAAGGVWSLWVPGSSIVQNASQERAKLCANFAVARRDALGASTSLNQTAVLLSETSWQQERLEGNLGHYDPDTPEHVALALQDACYGVDIVNEAILRSRIASYRTVFVANQRSVDRDTWAALEQFVARGGLLVVTGPGLSVDAPSADTLLGLSRQQASDALERFDLGHTAAATRATWAVRADDAEVLARFASGAPLLTRKRHGKGAAAYLALATIPYPDDDAVMAWAMRAIGHGPAVHVEGAARGRHLVFSLRRKPGRVVLHVSDLTSHVQGRRIRPTAQNDIDAEPPIDEVALRLPLASKPRQVDAVPATTDVSWSWHDGVVRLALKKLDVHAAVLLRAQPQPPMRYMAASTPLALPHAVSDSAEEDFESLSPRQPLPASVGMVRASGRTAVRVTCRAAATGERCLKFIDHPDAPHSFHPYLILRPYGLNRDVGRLSLDLMLERAADVQLELRERENARAFPVGPSLRIAGTGELRAAGRDQPLASVPTGQWFHLDILFPLDGSGRYTVRLQTPGKQVQVFDDLPYRSRKFLSCRWAGIIGQGTAQAVFYVDNLKLGRVKKRTRLAATPLPARARAARAAAEDGLVGWWRFDEGKGGLAADSSGRANHGHVAARWAQGRVGSGLHLDGERGSNVMVEDSPDCRFGKGDLTIECWLRPESLDSPKGYRRLIDKSDHPHTWWNVDLLADGRVEMEMVDDGKHSGTTASRGVLPLAKWSHLAVVVDRERCQTRYYINGRLDSAAGIPRGFAGALDVAGRALTLGGSYLPFIGTLDEVKLYRRALTPQEIQASYTKATRTGQRTPEGQATP